MNRIRSNSLRSRGPAGFTLVEMLVATGLVALMMLLFAQMYSVAIGTMTEQRALANNDQRARVLSTILRSDLQNMTYRQASWPYGTVRGIVPLGPGDEPLVDPVNQRGYFYYSENDPADDTDDVLQFTAMIRIGQRGEFTTRNQQLPFTGRAANLAAAGVNQPLADDGDASNEQSQSRAAEICYFLRGGNLYRRVLLLRDPLPAAPRSDNQPTAANGARAFNPATPLTRNYLAAPFYRDFDFAATRVFDDPTDANGDGQTSFLWFHSLDSLDNTRGRSNVPIALPEHRFGFYNNPNFSNPTAAPHHGRPREYTENDEFFGRFTMEETSSAAMTWPGQQIATLADNSHRIHRAFPLGSLDADYRIPGMDGTRVAEDLLLTHVEAFDVTVYDPYLRVYLDFASGSAGNNENANPTYGPHPTTTPQNFNNVFDTWHPSAGMFVPPGNVVMAPPRRLFLSRDNGSWQLWTWVSGGDPSTIPQAYIIPHSLTPHGAHASMVYVHVSGNQTGDREPEWPLVPGNIVQDGNVIWECIDNRVGLTALQVVVRYRDLSSGLSRQVTILHSFVE